MTRDFEPAGVRLGVVRGISYGLFGAPGEFVGQAREIGAGLIRAYFYWSQVEPEPGRYEWTAVDALLDQLTGDEEVWITLCSSSPWGTRVPTDFLPPSPARDQGPYGDFVRRAAPRLFFDHLADAGRDAFDLFSVHLYGDVASVPGYLDQARDLMRRHGYLKPVVVGEHGGPQPFEFGEAMAVMQQTFAAAFSEPPPAQSTGELAARAGQDTPERRAMTALYDQMPSLPPALQMFMAGCPADLEARRDRINCRQVVARTLLALAGGVRRTAYWNLAPEYPGPADHLQMMHLLIGKLPLLGYRDGAPRVRHPAADTFALLAGQLAGARRVTRVEIASRPGLYAFEVDRDGRDPLLVLWDQRDAFAGEDEPPVTVAWPWPAAAAVVTDAFGQTESVQAGDGQVELKVGATPVFVTGPGR